jgi:hypothetical protein
MTDTSVMDLYANFVVFGRRDFDVFDREVLASLPSDGCLFRYEKRIGMSCE